MSIYTYNSAKALCKVLEIEFDESQAISDQQFSKIPEESKLTHKPWNMGKGHYQLGELNPFYGKSHKEETRKAWSRIRSGRLLSEETKSKLRGRVPHNKGVRHSEETRNKISEAKKGKPAHNKGIKASEIHKKKISEAKRGKPLGPCSDEKKSNIAKARVGKKWYKNIEGTESVCCYPGNQPTGWVSGMVKKKRIFNG